MNDIMRLSHKTVFALTISAVMLSPSLALQSALAAPATTQQATQNLIKQLTAPVRWTQISLAMVEDGATTFIEVGPGTVLQGLIKKVKADGEFISASI